MGIFEVDYKIKDAEVFKSRGKPTPTYIVADSVQEAVKKASEFEDDNLTLLKCNLYAQGYISVAKKFKGLEVAKESA